MKMNQWTLSLAALGVISLSSAVQAEEAQHQLMTAISSTTLSGHVDTSAIWKFGTGNANLPGRAFDGVGKLDGFNLNAVNLTIEKPLDEGAWSAGYKAELVFGADGAVYDATGQHIKQAYVTLNIPVGNGITVKAGAFDTVIGYETFNSVSNPNYSRSFGWQLEPTQHTGFLASYQAADWLGLSAGVANTWTPNLIAGASNVTGVPGESQKTYMGTITLTAPESTGFLSGAALYLGIVDGLAPGNGTEDTTSYYAGVSLPTPMEGLSLGAAFDYIENSSANTMFGSASARDNWAWSVAGYLSWQATEKLKLNARIDYINGSDGLFGIDAGVAGPTEQVELLSPTLTIDYSLWENVVSRVEFRLDHNLNDDKIYGGSPAGHDLDEDATTVALNIIYKF